MQSNSYKPFDEEPTIFFLNFLINNYISAYLYYFLERIKKYSFFYGRYSLTTITFLTA